MRFVLFCVLLSLLLTLARISITLSSDLSHALNFFDEASFSRFFRWAVLATMLLTFFGTSAVYAQRQLSERRQMLDDLRIKESALSTQAEEKIEIQRLLDERNELVSSFQGSCRITNAPLRLSLHSNMCFQKQPWSYNALTSLSLSHHSKNCFYLWQKRKYLDR